MKKLLLALIVLTSSSAFAQNFFGREYTEYLSAQNDSKSVTANTQKTAPIKNELEQKLVEIINNDNATQLERLIHNEPKILSLSISNDNCVIDDCLVSLYAASHKKKQTLKVLVRHGARLVESGGMPGDTPLSVESLAPQIYKEIQAEILAETQNLKQSKKASLLVSPTESPKFVLNLVKEDDAQALNEYLVQYPESINYVDHHYNLLQWACQLDHQRPNVAKILLRHGMDSSLPQEDHEQDGQGLDEPSPDNLCPSLISKIEAELKAETK